MQLVAVILEANPPQVSQGTCDGRHAGKAMRSEGAVEGIQRASLFDLSPLCSRRGCWCVSRRRLNWQCVNSSRRLAVVQGARASSRAHHPGEQGNEVTLSPHVTGPQAVSVLAKRCLPTNDISVLVPSVLSPPLGGRWIAKRAGQTRTGSPVPGQGQLS